LEIIVSALDAVPSPNLALDRSFLATDASGGPGVVPKIRLCGCPFQILEFRGQLWQVKDAP